MMKLKSCEGCNAPKEPEELLHFQRIESGDLNDRSVNKSPLKIKSRAKEVQGFEQPESTNRGAASSYLVNMGAKRSSSMTSTFAASTCAADNSDSKRGANSIRVAGTMSMTLSQKASPLPATALSSGASSSSISHDALSRSSFQASIKRSFDILSKIDLGSGNDYEPFGLLYHPGVESLYAKEWTKDEKDSLLKFVNKHIGRESSERDSDDCAAKKRRAS